MKGDVNMAVSWEEVQVTHTVSGATESGSFKVPLFINTKAVKVGDYLKFFQEKKIEPAQSLDYIHMGGKRGGKGSYPVGKKAKTSDAP